LDVQTSPQKSPNDLLVENSGSSSDTQKLDCLVLESRHEILFQPIQHQLLLIGGLSKQKLAILIPLSFQRRAGHQDISHGGIVRKVQNLIRITEHSI
jgi:hypothetical protein